MCSAKRRNKIKTERRAPEHEERGAGQGINPEINQTAGVRARQSSSRRHSLQYRLHTEIICIRYFIGLRLYPDNFVVSPTSGAMEPSLRRVRLPYRACSLKDISIPR